VTCKFVSHVSVEAALGRKLGRERNQVYFAAHSIFLNHGIVVAKVKQQ
jgi:hypothetical protein